MKKLLIILVLASVACSKDDPEPSVKYDSLEGAWAYTFPDNKVSFSFELVKTSAGYDVVDAVVTYDGQNFTDHTSAEFKPFVEGNTIGGIVIDKQGNRTYNIVVNSIEPIKANAEIKAGNIRYLTDTHGVLNISDSPVLKRATD
jgi:hypothetical protein